MRGEHKACRVQGCSGTYVRSRTEACPEHAPAFRYLLDRDVQLAKGADRRKTGRHLELRKAAHIRDPRKAMVAQAKWRARKAGLPFDLRWEDLVVPKFCPYLGAPISVGDGSPGPWSPSLDRIDPTGGYVLGNVRVISRKANIMKNDATPDQLLVFAESVIRIHGEDSR